jgi:hypothetical protein
MTFLQTAQKRILTVIGLVLIAIAVDGIFTSHVFAFNSPTLGGVLSNFATPDVQQTVAFQNWPFYIPLAAGCVMIAADLYYHLTKNKVQIG